MMLVIKNNSVRSVSATSENPNYPASNLLDRHPTRDWKAADASVSSAVIHVDVSGKTGGLGLVGIVADSAVVDISDPNGIVWQNVDWQNVDWISVPQGLHIQTMFEHGNPYSTLWVSFDQFDSAVDISITLFKDGGSSEVLSAGTLVVGEMDEISGMQYPVNDGLKDYSISRPLANGSPWYKKRNIVRTMGGTLRVSRDVFFRFNRDLAQKYGQTPMMWNLMDCAGMEFVMYGRLSVMPSGAHQGQDRATIDFEITEEL